MNDNLNESYFTKLAEALNNIIPVEWDKIAYYAEVEPDVVGQFFYFREKGNPTYIQGGEICEKYNVNRKEYIIFVSEVYDLIQEFHSEYSEKANSKWNALTFVLESTGKFKTEFCYEDLESISETERRKEWKEKYLT